MNFHTTQLKKGRDSATGGPVFSLEVKNQKDLDILECKVVYHY